MASLRGGFLIVVVCCVVVEGLLAGSSSIDSEEEDSKTRSSDGVDSELEDLGDLGMIESDENSDSDTNESTEVPSNLNQIAFDPGTGIRIFTNEVTWKVARKVCQSFGPEYDLLSLENPTQIEYTRELLPIVMAKFSFEIEGFWLAGITRLESPGRGWYWVNSPYRRLIDGAPPISKFVDEVECLSAHYGKFKIGHKPHKRPRLRVQFGYDDCDSPLAIMCSVIQPLYH